MRGFLLLIAVVLQVASQCTECPSCTGTTNPTFEGSCSANIVLILDESGSIFRYRQETVEAASSFWNSLAQAAAFGGSARMGLVEFNDVASVVFGPELRALDNAYLADLNDYVTNMGSSGPSYSPEGNTQWGKVLKLVRTTSWSTRPDVVIMFTDGKPNGFETPCDSTCSSLDPDLATACYQADLLKSQGTKLFVVGVGEAGANQASIARITGPTVWDQQPGSFSTADYVPDPDLLALGPLLASVVDALCPTCFIDVRPCDGPLCTGRFSSYARISGASLQSPFVGPQAELFGYIYVDDQLGKVGYELMAPDQTSWSRAGIVRTDVLSPCKLARRVRCTQGCYSVFSSEGLPRYFRDASDTRLDSLTSISAPLPGVVCRNRELYRKQLGSTYSGEACTSTTCPSAVEYLWGRVTNNRFEPCAAKLADGTLVEFFQDVNRAGVGIIPAISGTPAQLPGATEDVAWAQLERNCVEHNGCDSPVDIMFVVDEQFAATSVANRFLTFKRFVEDMIGRFPSAASRFGVTFANNNGNAGTPLVFPVGTERNSLITVVQQRAPGGGQTDWADAITEAVQRSLWTPTSTPTVPRQLVIVMGGDSSTPVNRAPLDALAAQYGYSVVVAATNYNAPIAAQLATSSEHVEPLLQTSFATAVDQLWPKVCPQSSRVCDSCAGFCACVDLPGSSGCTCPRCPSNICVNSPCSDPSLGCQGDPVSCDDNNVCTDDVCNPESDSSSATFPCVHTPRSCDDGDACTTDTCNPLSGCSNLPITCDDNNRCTSDTCVGGSCVSTPICDDTAPEGCRLNPCIHFAELGVPFPCEGLLDRCTNVECRRLDFDCDAYRYNTECVVTPRPIEDVCPERNPCNNYTCSLSVGCLAEYIGDRCVAPSLCQSATCDVDLGCVYSPLVCDDRNPCTVDSCDETLGCVYTPLVCDDGDACTNDQCSVNGTCVYTPIACSDGDPCTIDSCEAGKCISEQDCSDTVDPLCRPDPCEGNPCASGANACQVGVCTRLTPFNCTSRTFDYTCTYEDLPLEAVCGVQDPCVEYSCNPSAGGCVRTLVPNCNATVACSSASDCPKDGLFCTNDLCSPGLGCIYEPIVCPEKPCGINVCSESAGGDGCSFFYNCSQCPGQNPCDPNPCNDGDACTRNVCTPNPPSTQLVPGGTAADCVRGYTCSYPPAVVPNCESDACTLRQCQGTRSDREPICNVTDISGACDDNNLCTVDICNPISGCQNLGDANCDDNNLCTVDTCTAELGCVHTPVDCRDDIRCTIDRCDPVLGCIHNPEVCPPRTCGVNICLEELNGECQLQYNCSECPPPNPCQNNNMCDDGNACTKDECVPGPPPTLIIPRGDVRDCPWNYTCTYTPVLIGGCTSDVCTTRTCEPIEGSSSNFTCSQVDISCDDNDGCTIDTCDVEAGGCVHTPVDCPSQNACVPRNCTATGLNSFECINLPAIDCDDGLNCTVDTCDPTSGCVNTPVVCNRTSPCHFVLGCYEEAGSVVSSENITINVVPGCNEALLVSLLDFCGTCLGDNVGCFFEEEFNFINTIPIIVVPAVVAGVIALLAAFFAGKKGYDTYKAQAALNHRVANTSPAYREPGTGGDMIDLDLDGMAGM